MTAKPEFILTLRMPGNMDALPKLTKDYIQMMAAVYKRAIYNIYYDNIPSISKKEVIQLTNNTTQMIAAYTLNCFRFMKANGNPQLNAWLHFGRQETQRLTNKFPSIQHYIKNMTDPDPSEDLDQEIENRVTKYRIRFLSNMETTKPGMAVSSEE